jgi:hypothetical protein
MLDGGAVSGIEQGGGITEVKFNATVDVVEVRSDQASDEYGNSGHHQHGVEERHQPAPRRGLLFHLR